MPNFCEEKALSPETDNCPGGGHWVLIIESSSARREHEYRNWLSTLGSGDCSEGTHELRD